MSAASQHFIAEATAGNWDQAYFWLNSLSMYEMLRSLAALTPAARDNLHRQAFRYFSKYGVLRIEFAFRVVVDGKVPLPAPGDLEATGQVQDARNFLAERNQAVTLGYEKRPYAPDQYKGPGAFVRVVVWRLHNAGPAANGYIVQKVKNTYNFGPCGGEATSRVEVYWEAWKVSGGKIVTGSTLGFFPQDGDEFGMDASPRTKGMKMKEGWAKYLPGYTAPDGWGTEAFAHAGTSMPSTFREPGPPWSEQGAIYRWYRIVYDDCGANTSRFESFDGDTRPVVE